MRRIILEVAALVLVAPALLNSQAPQSPQTPPRDIRQRTDSAGTATVRGVVVAAATGRPLHRVRLTLNGGGANSPTAVTNTEGAFELTGVPAGSYSLTAVRAGYLTIQYGQRRPREAGRTLDVREGDTIDNVNLALYRGGVLAGRITDEQGQPAVGVRLEAVELRYLRGQRIPLQAASTTTNDIGQYRISGLQPGTYQLRASSTETWAGEDGSGLTYAVTSFPGVTGTDPPRNISVTVGQEVGNLDFPLAIGRAARITGALQDAAGDPLAGQSVTLSRATRGVGGALFSTGAAGSTRTARDGTFEFADLAPGEYILNYGTREAGSNASIIVAHGDAPRVTMTPRKTSAIAGMVVAAAGETLDFPATTVRVSPIGMGPQSLLPSFTGPPTQPQPVKPDWTFRIDRLDDAYVFRPVGLPADWVLRSVTIDDRDITDTPLDTSGTSGERSGLRIVVSRSGARLSGVALGADGQPFPDATVIVFAADARLWGPATRFVRVTRPGNDGRFGFSGLSPGAYLAVARDFVADGQWEDPEFLRGLVSNAVALDLAARASLTTTLKVEVPR